MTPYKTLPTNKYTSADPFTLRTRLSEFCNFSYHNNKRNKKLYLGTVYDGLPSFQYGSQINNKETMVSTIKYLHRRFKVNGGNQ